MFYLLNRRLVPAFDGASFSQEWKDAPWDQSEDGGEVEEAIIVAFRKHMLLPLDDCLYALQATIPHLTRSSTALLTTAISLDQAMTASASKPTPYS